MITKMSLAIIDGVRCEQNVEKLVWPDKNVLGSP